MASNFQLYYHRTQNSLHMKLYGDFDGSSAHELLNALIEHGTGAHQIFIDTNDLKTIHSFGQEVFQNNFCSIGNRFINFSFIGKNKHIIAPERDSIIG